MCSVDDEWMSFVQSQSSDFCMTMTEPIVTKSSKSDYFPKKNLNFLEEDDENCQENSAEFTQPIHNMSLFL